MVMFGKTHFTNRIVWIVAVFFCWYLIIGDMAYFALDDFFSSISANASDGVKFVLEFYAPTLGTVLVFLLMCVVFKKDRFMLEVVRPSREKRSFHWLWIGLLLGFLTNFFCVLCALIHGDIKLYFEFSAAEIPFMLFALVCVFIQSTSEELWCRVMLYERVNVHYPLWVAMAVNSVIFGLLHSFNDGITAIAMADLMLCGLSYSLLRWYTGSIWTSMGIHTMWNFTQNFIFGLPNSGLISKASIFHLDAANGISNLIYSYEFGVEGALPAVFVDLLLAVVILWLAKRDGRLGELLQSREQLGTAPPDSSEPPKYVEFEE